MILKATASDSYLSFAYTASPPGVPTGGARWMRIGYASETGAMPLLFQKDPAGRAHTYVMYSPWPGYEGYVSYCNEGTWLRADYDSDADAMPVTLELLPGNDGAARHDSAELAR